MYDSLVPRVAVVCEAKIDDLYDKRQLVTIPSYDRMETGTQQMFQIKCFIVFYTAT